MIGLQQPSAPERPDLTLVDAVRIDHLDTWLATSNAVAARRQTMDELRHALHRNPCQLRNIAYAGAEPVGVGCVITDRLKPDGAMYALIRVLAHHRCQGVGSAVHDELVRWAREHDGSYLQVVVRDTSADALAFWTGRGYREVERDIVVGLDLASAEVAAVDHARVRIVRLSERPELLRAVYEVGAATWGDIPVHEPCETIPFHEWVECVTEMPGNSPEYLFVAMLGDQPVGYAQLELRPAEPGVAWHCFTGVRRERRGQGIARALKQHQVRWAQEQGLRMLYTGNDEGNAAMRRVNGKLGYTYQYASLLLRGDIA